jgi:hypothetical protein
MSRFIMSVLLFRKDARDAGDAAGEPCVPSGPFPASLREAFIISSFHHSIISSFHSLSMAIFAQ